MMGGGGGGGGGGCWVRSLGRGGGGGGGGEAGFGITMLFAADATVLVVVHVEQLQTSEAAQTNCLFSNRGCALCMQ